MRADRHTWRDIAAQQEPPLTDQEWCEWYDLCAAVKGDKALFEHLFATNPLPKPAERTANSYADLVTDAVASRQHRRRDLALWREWRT